MHTRQLSGRMWSALLIILAGLAAIQPVLAAFSITATVETAPMPNQDSADDPAIWIHPTDPAQSAVIGANKLNSASGGLYVYDLGGSQIQHVSSPRYNNVDLRYNVTLAGEPVDLVVASERTTNSLKVYTIDPATRQLTDVTGATGVSFQPYGLALYHSPISGKLYAFVSARLSPYYVYQYELTDSGNGHVNATLVRTINNVGGSGESEGLVADDVMAYLYIGEEDVGIWKYGAEPGDGVTRVAVDAVGGPNGLTADVEGLTLYYAYASVTGPDDSQGYLIASSQGSSEYLIYERGGNNAFVDSFNIVNGPIDGTINSDGIDVNNAYLGSAFPAGVFIAHDDTNDTGGENFKLAPWDAIALQSTQVISDTSWNPRDDPSPAQCRFYLGTALDSTQFYTAELTTPALASLGPLHPAYNLEGLDIHPATGVLYAASGGSDHAGELFLLDGHSGVISYLGDSGADEVTALAFRDADATLWGWTEQADRGQAMIQIDYTNGAATEQCWSPTRAGGSPSYEIEGLAWSADGGALYAAYGSKLYTLADADPLSPTNTCTLTMLRDLAPFLPAGASVQALDTLPNAWLLMGYPGGANPDGTQQLVLARYDPLNDALIELGQVTVPAEDDSHIAALAWRGDCGMPPYTVDLRMSKSVTPALAAPGATVTFTLAFSNTAGLATGVVITDHIPLSLTHVSVASSGVVITDTAASPTYVWAVQDLVPGVSGVITLTGQISTALPSGHSFTNTTSIAGSVSDRNPDNNSAAATLTVVNQPPVAHAGADQTAAAHALVLLDGGASHDPDGHMPLVFGWTQSGGPVVLLSSPAVSQPTFLAPDGPAVLTFTLLVTDALGLPSTLDAVVITVTATPNQPPVAQAGTDQTAAAHALVTLDGSASHDPDGHLPLTFGWTQSGGPAVLLSSPAVSQPTFLAPGGPAVLTFTLLVTDALGLLSAPDAVVIMTVSLAPPNLIFLPLAVKTSAPHGWQHTLHALAQPSRARRK